MGYLRGEVEVFDADIIGITESWTDGSICDAEILELEPILALGLIGVRSGVTSSRPNRRV